MSKKNNLFLFVLSLWGLTSCSTSKCFYQETVEVPCNWQTSLECGETTDDPTCFLWWEALEDPVLTSLIEKASTRNRDVLLARLQSKEALLKAINAASSEIARTYIELRGLQMQSKLLQENHELQTDIFLINQGLSDKGFLSSIEENEDQNNLNALEVKKAAIDLSIKKTVFHLATLLGYSPGGLNEILCQGKELPELGCNIPIGFPMGVVCRNPSVREARKAYEAARVEATFLQYQKAVLDALESAESALAAFNSEQNNVKVFENTRNLKAETYALTKDLYNQGLKDDRDLLLAHQALILADHALIQSRVALLMSYVNLYFALGGGWEVC